MFKILIFISTLIALTNGSGKTSQKLMKTTGKASVRTERAQAYSTIFKFYLKTAKSLNLTIDIKHID
jgi:hypothetical protein